jgi:YHS domain-containing protein
MDNSSEGSEEMVKDTECNRYILKKSSKSIEIKGETFYFCSDECLKKFKKKKK